MNPDKHFSYELQKHLQNEEEAERRQEEVEELVDLFLNKDGEFYPFRTLHFEEAIQNSDLQQLCALMQVGDSKEIAAELNRIAYNYWEPVARAKAMGIVYRRERE